MPRTGVAGGGPVASRAGVGAGAPRPEQGPPRRDRAVHMVPCEGRGSESLISPSCVGMFDAGEEVPENPQRRSASSGSLKVSTSFKADKWREYDMSGGARAKRGSNVAVCRSPPK